MRVVFMGTPEFAIPSLDAVMNSRHEVVAVVTGADKPAGRALRLTESPVKIAARRYNLPILQPLELQDPIFTRALTGFHYDINMVVAFRILPPEVFSLPRLGSINLHASLLPNLRGAAPINWALMRGCSRTGVTTFLIERKVDTGIILLQEEVDILPDDDAGTLAAKLAQVGAQLAVKTLDGLEDGSLQPTTQIGKITTAPRLTPEICRIDWNKRADEIHNQVRGLSPRPGAFSTFDSKLVKLYRTTVLSGSGEIAPGTIILSQGERFIVKTGAGDLEILELQFEGKRRLTAAEFLRGRPLRDGTKFDA